MADTIGCGMPWQLAHNDPGYYQRAFGTLFPSWAQIALMDHIHKRLDEGMIVDALWYSTHDPFGVFSAADLLDANGHLMPLGQHYMQLKSVSRTAEHTVHLPMVAA